MHRDVNREAERCETDCFVLGVKVNVWHTTFTRTHITAESGAHKTAAAGNVRYRVKQPFPKAAKAKQISRNGHSVGLLSTSKQSPAVKSRPLFCFTHERKMGQIFFLSELPEEKANPPFCIQSSSPRPLVLGPKLGKQEPCFNFRPKPLSTVQKQHWNSQMVCAPTLPYR